MARKPKAPEAQETPTDESAPQGRGESSGAEATPPAAPDDLDDLPPVVPVVVSNKKKRKVGSDMKAPTLRGLMDDPPFLKLLLVGAPGAGKTYLASTIVDHPSIKKAIVANFEGGEVAISHERREKLAAAPIRTIDHFEGLFWAIVNKQPGYADIDCVIVDSGTELQALDLEERVRARWEDNKRESLDDYYQEDYGKSTAKLRRIFRWFRDAPFHLVITALEKEVYKPAPNPRPKDYQLVTNGILPNFTKKLGDSVAGYVDHVWYLSKMDDEENGGSKRFLLTDKMGLRTSAKTRGSVFMTEIGQVVQDPNLSDLYQQFLDTEYPHRAGRG